MFIIPPGVYNCLDIFALKKLIQVLNEEYVLELNKMSKSKLIQHLRQKGLLLSNSNCSFCNTSMNKHACNRVIDSRIFKCKNKVCIKKTRTASIRKNFFFMHFKLTLIITKCNLFAFIK